MALREADENARTLLNNLADQVQAQRGIVQRANQRLAALAGQPAEIAVRHTSDDKGQTVPYPPIATAEREKAAAQAQLDRLISRETAIRSTRWRGIGELDAWVKAQRSFTLAPPVVIPKGATLAKARTRLAEIAADRRVAESAPLPKADATTLIRAQVAALATPMEAHSVLRGHPLKIPTTTTRPRLYGQAGEQPLNGFAAVESVNTLGLMAWLFEDELVERIAEQLPDDQPGAMTNADRAERLAELSVEKLEVERIEEALLGGELRRQDADPRAVLGLA
jgi:hypothetical protein